MLKLIKEPCVILSGVKHVAQNNKTKVNVDIYNKTYKIVGNEPAHHVRLVASLVDQKMKDIQLANGQLDTTMLAVLTAVNTMNDYLKLKEEHASLLNLRKQKEE